MKNFLSIILSIAVFAMSFFSGTMAIFAMPEFKAEVFELSDNSMECDMHSEKNKSTNHECCFSPIKNSLLFSYYNNSEDKKINFSIKSVDFLAIINEDLSINFLQKLHSPPNFSTKYIIYNENYTNLIGIIKNIL